MRGVVLTFLSVAVLRCARALAPAPLPEAAALFTPGSARALDVPAHSSHRQLLQGDAPNATLPNLFNLPVCSRHGSHNTTVLRQLPRIQLGVLKFGPQDVKQREFHPLSSVYVEPILVLMMPGVVGWLICLCSCCCFCYRRYRLGLCGEPIPTVRSYTPREVCIAMGVTVASTCLLCTASALAVLVADTSYNVAFADVVRVGFETEDVMNASLRAGVALLDDAMSVTSALDDFESIFAAHVDPAALQAELQCSLTLLATLPDGPTMKSTALALGAATLTFPPVERTDVLFADLRRPQQRYPDLVPPLSASLSSLQARVAGLPDLSLLARRLEVLNASVVNTTSVPTQIVGAIGRVNSSLANLPNLTLLDERLGKVSHLQVASGYVCSNIPVGWQPGDTTECDELREQLLQAKVTLEATDAEAPLSLLYAYASLAADFPPLTDIVDAMGVEAAQLAAMPNLTKLEVEYTALNATMNGWSPTVIADAIGDVASAAAALAAADAPLLVPQLQTVQGSLGPLACVQSVLAQLTAVNESLLALSPAVEVFFRRANSLSRSLIGLPDPASYVAALTALDAALSALPDLQDYTTGVQALSAALSAMPPTDTLVDAVGAIGRAIGLPPSFERLSNVTHTLNASMARLPPSRPFEASLDLVNVSRYELPPLIDAAVAAIEAYDTLGDTSELEQVELARAALRRLSAAVDARPEEAPLLTALLDVDAELDRVPPTQPTVAQLEALDAALATLPSLAGYLTGLGGLQTATESAPSVDALGDAWRGLNETLGAVPAYAVVEAPLSIYAAEQAQLPTPPTALLDGALDLQRRLATLPALVGEGAADLQSTYTERRATVESFRRGLFGEDLTGYVIQLEDMRPSIEWAWWTFLVISFAVPAGCSVLAVLSCVLRFGRPALHAGHALMTLLPWYLLLGASVEMPLALMLQDACDHVPYLTARFTAYLALEYGDQFGNIAEPLNGWVTGCPPDAGGDPLATYFSPMVRAANHSYLNATREIVSLELRPQVQASVEHLAAEARSVAHGADVVHEMMACGKVHSLYEEVHTAVCCDLAYAFTAMWSARFVAIWAIAACAVAAVAGYKRFRKQRNLWGPYATVQSLEVGSYL